MPIIGSNLKNLHFERFEQRSKDLKLGSVKTDIKINNVFQRKVNLPKIKKAIVFEFEYWVNYNLEKPADKKLGEIKVVGELIYADDQEKQKEIMSNWKKDKKIESELIRNIISSALEMSQLEALYLARKVMLPSPIPLPKLKFSGKKQDYIG